MSAIIEIHPPLNNWHANAVLPASKSLSNRWLILEALSKNTIVVDGHSDAEDTVRLQEIIRNKPVIADAGAGGTTFRFALAYLCTCEGYEGTMRGSVRLHERPVKPLVDALLALGADINYLEKEGFPPLAVRGKNMKGGQIHLSAEISSQFLSAILLIAPALQEPLTIHTGNKITSRPYLDMTLALLQLAGQQVEEKEGTFTVYPKPWSSGRFKVEKDWSSASYWYALAALSPGANIFLPGLQLDSLQGDAHTAKLFAIYGVNSEEKSNGIQLTNSGQVPDSFEFDFRQQPDLAQTMAVVVAGLKKQALFSGLDTLRRKETDRIQALRNELAKLDVITSEPREGELMIDATNARCDKELIVDTYDDHRMALAFAALSLTQYRLQIRDPEVVKKSYPGFWTELRKAGFHLKVEES
ncbi:MAG: 3-phosphoshikimate 1-carboxyvinyltransferase [Bacteroidia bacterium]|nr:3-phosphoshikimate 1-carboxyvinyltransferase [Bacteroidia bacterium]